MKTIDEFLSELRSLDIKVWLEGAGEGTAEAARLRYKAPKGTLKPALLGQLRERKAEIIEFLNKFNTATNSNLAPILPVKRDKNLPLSFAQQRLWFLDQLEGKSPAYNIPMALRLIGELDLTALEQTVCEIVRRHEVLRTSFPSIEGIPTQVINPEANLLFKIVDLSNTDKIKRNTQLQQSLQQEITTPFNLATGPLIRSNLWQLSSNEYVLLINIHHIVSDGWSMGVFLQELSSLYQAFTQGEPSPLAELPIQYADFALWQRQWLRGEVLETQLNYWQEQLDGAPELLQLPTDRPRPTVQTYRGATQTFSLNTELTQKLLTLSRNSGTTLFMTLLAAFATLLYRYSGQSDILIGSPIANRNRSEIESLIGFFVNTLVLRTSFEDNPRFESLLAQVRETTLQAYSHQDIGFEQIVEALQPERSLNHSPLFQVMFILQNAPSGELELPGVTLKPLKPKTGMAKFDLTLSLRETKDGLVGSWNYNTDLFDSETIFRMAGHFQTLLSAIVENPQQRVAELPLLTQAEKHQLLVEWNETTHEYPREKCIHQLFESQVEQTPEAVALVFEDQQLTYRELNARANQLAHYLRSLGVKPEVPVGICLERSVEMVVGLLGILKAGGAYIPLEPSYPRERIALILAEAQVAIVITQQSCSSLLRELEEIPYGGRAPQVLYLDRDWSQISQENGENLPNIVQPKNLAYIIYTSGSTGQPKGVAIEHRGVVNMLLFRGQKLFSPEEQTISPFTISFAFDGSVPQLFAPLCMGSKVIILPLGDLAALHSCMEQEKIQTLTTIPSLMETYLQNFDLPPSVAVIGLGAEAVSEQLLEKLIAYPHVRKVLNLYGPTEATIGATAASLFDRENPALANSLTPGRPLPIGRPMQNVEIYILDSHLQPVPVGITGELYISGIGLARGYHNQPQLTAERFIANPFNHQGRGRLYKTGDLARYRRDGQIEFLGRRDRQVKIRGLRIELAEIEAALTQHPGLRECVVQFRDDPKGDSYLVAYAVPSSASACSPGDLSNFLQGKLPKYMVPAVFMMRETLPRLSSGKVDRQALPVPDLSQRSMETKFVAPRTPTEKVLSRIWSELLNLEQVGIYDNFFELGGHSLLATQLVSSVRQNLSVELPLTTVFSSPTVASLNQTITELRTTQSGFTLPPIKPQQADSEQLPLSWAQERLWFIDQLESGSATYNIPMAMRLIGELDLTVLEQTLCEIVRRHEVLRTSFPSIEGIPTQVINSEANLLFKIVDLSNTDKIKRNTQLQQSLQQEITTPFNLATGPLIRSNLWQLSSNEYVLLVNIHHIVSDGWSMGVLRQELSSLYQAFALGKPSPLPELPLQYGDFALWQRQWLSGEVLENQLNYWKQQLGGAPELLQLPTDRPRPSIQTYKGSNFSFSLSAQLSKKLKTLSTQSGTTLFMTLLGALATLLYRLTGQSDILIGSPVANRNRSEIENLIGFFVNTLVLRTKLEDNPSFTELLAQVRETTLKAYSHQDIGFEQIVEALQPERSLSHSPLFQVMFVLQNAPSGELELPGVTLKPLKPKTGIAKFDLTLFMRETKDGLVGSWEYSTDLFDRETIFRMAGHFQTLLSAIVENPQQRVDELPLLTQAEKHQLLVEWNDTTHEYPREKCIHELFESQVERTPNAVAVVFEDKQLTYRELNARANQLAHYLRSLGVKPEVLVGICLERSIEMVVGLLAILKAGGAYVPLDPAYPTERLAFMLDDAQVAVLLTQKHLLTKLPELLAQVVCIQRDWQAISRESKESPTSGVKSENLGYVIYTSGSTGQPKGVTMKQLALTNLIWWQLQNSPVDTCTKTLQFAPVSFDVSFQEIFSTWCGGGTLVLVSAELRRDPSALLQFLETEQISRLFLPFVALQQLAEIAENSQVVPTSLRELITAGEQLQITHSIASLMNKLTDCTLHNQYGPSESHVVTALTLRESADTWPVLPPIGRPIANTQIYILNRHLQPSPIGVPGELHIGGAPLARGYLNRPELTQEKFIPNPFDKSKIKSQKSKVYKTGDLARYLPDGNIEFLGRIDNQVKIRGFRIEPGEIETVLTQYPNIEESIVLVREDIPGDKRLVAYIVPIQEQVPTLEELRSFLKQKLPNYMIPSALVPIEAMPLTPSGKIDRRALANLDIGRQTSAQTHVAPRNPTEKKLAEIWVKVLWLDQEVGIHDNFFDLGGHSLLSVRLVAEIEKAFHRKLPIAALFQLGTIAELASILDKETETTLTPIASEEALKHSQLPLEIYHQLLAYTAGWKGKRVKPNSLIVGMNTKGTKQPLFWCLQGFRELHQLAKYLGGDQPVYGMRSGHLILKYTPENIQALASHYVQEILEVQSESPYLIGGNCQAAHIAREIAGQLIGQGKTVALLLLLEDYRPKTYPGQVALFLGRESYIDLAKHCSQAELAWQELYRAGFSLNLISGIHGQFFNEPNIQEFTAQIKTAISVALKEPMEPIDNYCPLPESELVVKLREALQMIASKPSNLVWQESIGEVWNSHVHQAMAEIKSLIPQRETLILVDEEQWETSELLPDYRCLPFLEKDGHYWGTPPDDVTAIGELERLRQQGANFIIFGWPAFWWLEFYQGLRHHLEQTYPKLTQNDHIIVFELTTGQ